jgi:hypothetical protein
MKGSCRVVPNTGLFLPEEDAISQSVSSLLREGDSAAGIARSLFKNSFFAIVYFDYKATTYFLTVGDEISNFVRLVHVALAAGAGVTPSVNPEIR